MLAWVSVLLADRMVARHAVGMIRGGAVSVLLLAGLLTLVQFASSHGITEMYMEYDLSGSLSPFVGLDTE